VASGKGAPADDTAGESVADLGTRLELEVQGLDRELKEIEMLIAQARTEAGRHEQKRSQTAEKVTGAVNLPQEDLLALNTQLVTLTRRAAVMEAQVEVLEGKHKTLTRFREMLAELARVYGGIEAVGGGTALLGDGSAGGGAGGGGPMSRIVLNAQEDLRREIARAMHDGPAQSLTNITLQAQIVERLLKREDPADARDELRLLVQMVQQTLEATKTFIFDVRPMVLDDLGLVPTLRRAARERGRRAGIPVEFDSLGADQRIDVDVESSLFRILDEALAAYLAGKPDRVTVRLDWTESVVEADVTAYREPTAAMARADRQVSEAHEAAASSGKDLPPALEAMLVERTVQAEAAAAAARHAAVVALPESTWQEIVQRAVSTGIVAKLGEAGESLHLRAEIGLTARAGEGAS